MIESAILANSRWRGGVWLGLQQCARHPENWIAKDINLKSCYDDLKQTMLESTKIPEKERFTALTSNLGLV